MPGRGDADPTVFDGDFLRRLERLELLAKKLFRGLLRGERRSTRRGRSMEFADFRRYRPGDDFRHIDWNIYSRLDRLFLKLYAAEEDLTLHLLLDASASMGYGRLRKFDYARRLAAALAYIGLHNLDRVGLSVFSDRLGEGLPALKTRHHMATLLDFLRDLQCRDRTQFGAAFGEFASRHRHPGLVVLISDLFGAGSAAPELEPLRRRGHDLVVLQILAEEEIEPGFDGDLNLLDAEDGSGLKITVDAELRALYQTRLTDWLQGIEGYCRRRGVDYLRTSTAIPFEDVVLKYLRQGALLR